MIYDYDLMMYLVDLINVFNYWQCIIYHHIDIRIWWKKAIQSTERRVRAALSLSLNGITMQISHVSILLINVTLKIHVSIFCYSVNCLIRFKSLVKRCFSTVYWLVFILNDLSMLNVTSPTHDQIIESCNISWNLFMLSIIQSLQLSLP